MDEAEQRKEESIMRQATNISNPDGLSNEELILRRRGAFKFLPSINFRSKQQFFSFIDHLLVASAFSSDLAHGSWWFLWASFLGTLVPIFPLVSVVESQSLWGDDHAREIPIPEDIAVYSLLIFCGILYTIGSGLLIPAFSIPRPEPYCRVLHFHTDELVAMWLFFLGTLPTVAIMGMFVYYQPHYGSYKLALALCVVCCVGCLLFVYSVYPKEKVHSLIAPYLKSCFGEHSYLYKHLGNDFLIGCWLMFFASIGAVIFSIGLIIHYSQEGEARGVFDYSTGLVDAVMFAIGSAYFVAGSYGHVEKRKPFYPSHQPHLPPHHDDFITSLSIQMSPRSGKKYNNNDNEEEGMSREKERVRDEEEGEVGSIVFVGKELGGGERGGVGGGGGGVLVPIGQNNEPI